MPCAATVPAYRCAAQNTMTVVVTVQKVVHELSPWPPATTIMPETRMTP
jgi:hypothetical protein